jgi:hypothetical protein
VSGVLVGAQVKAEAATEEKVSWAIQRLKETQEYKVAGKALSDVQPGRLVQLDLWGEEYTGSGPSSSSAGATTPAGVESLVTPRYSLTVLDVGVIVGKKSSGHCGVLLVPQGREHEFLFASEEGQRQLAQVGTLLLIIIRTYYIKKLIV